MMTVMDICSIQVARPTLIVNAEDDMVCLAENIREDIVAALPGALLLRFRSYFLGNLDLGFFGISTLSSDQT